MIAADENSIPKTPNRSLVEKAKLAHEAVRAAVPDEELTSVLRRAEETLNPCIFSVPLQNGQSIAFASLCPEIAPLMDATARWSKLQKLLHEAEEEDAERTWSQCVALCCAREGATAAAFAAYKAQVAQWEAHAVAVIGSELGNAHKETEDARKKAAHAQQKAESLDAQLQTEKAGREQAQSELNSKQRLVEQLHAELRAQERVIQELQTSVRTLQSAPEMTSVEPGADRIDPGSAYSDCFLTDPGFAAAIPYACVRGAWASRVSELQKQVKELTELVAALSKNNP